MALIPYEPFRYLENWKRDMDRFFTEAIPAFASGFNMPRMDLYETPAEVVVSCELPGLEKKEDVHIEVEDNVLTISGSINRDYEVGDENLHRRERYVGRFQRSVTLPTRVMAEGTRATYRNGILEVRMPKAASENRKRIDVDFH